MHYTVPEWVKLHPEYKPVQKYLSKSLPMDKSSNFNRQPAPLGKTGDRSRWAYDESDLLRVSNKMMLGKANMYEPVALNDGSLIFAPSDKKEETVAALSSTKERELPDKNALLLLDLSNSIDLLAQACEYAKAGDWDTARYVMSNLANLIDNIKNSSYL